MADSFDPLAQHPHDPPDWRRLLLGRRPEGNSNIACVNCHRYLVAWRVLRVYLTGGGKDLWPENLFFCDDCIRPYLGRIPEWTDETEAAYQLLRASVGDGT